MYIFIVEKGMIIPAIPRPIIFTTRIVDNEVLEGLRLTANVNDGRVGVATYNNLVRRVDFSLERLSLKELRNSIPFDPSVFTLPVDGAMTQ
jgi:hypothetical protein